LEWDYDGVSTKVIDVQGLASPSEIFNVQT